MCGLSCVCALGVTRVFVWPDTCVCHVGHVSRVCHGCDTCVYDLSRVCVPCCVCVCALGVTRVFVACHVCVRAPRVTCTCALGVTCVRPDTCVFAA